METAENPTEKRPMGVVIRELIDEKKVSITALHKKTGFDRVKIYRHIERIKDLEPNILSAYLEALDVSPAEFEALRLTFPISPTDSVRVGDAFSENIIKNLQEFFANSHFQRLMEQKDEQLKNLMEENRFKNKIIESLLGKDRGVTLTHPAAIIIHPFGQFPKRVG